jgi:soluble P-type ATPase
MKTAGNRRAEKSHIRGEPVIEIEIPGLRTLRLHHLVMDYNGTLARDGALLDGVRQRLDVLRATLRLHVVTADTFGAARKNLEGVECELAIIPEGGQAGAKLSYVQKLGAEGVVSIGNGRNDRLMLKHSALGIALVQEEGASFEALCACHVAVRSINDALDLLLHPRRLIATLRD